MILPQVIAGRELRSFGPAPSIRGYRTERYLHMARKSRKKKTAPPRPPVASPAGGLSRGGEALGRDACGGTDAVPASSAADAADAFPAGSADLANAGSAGPSSAGLPDAANARSTGPSSDIVSVGGAAKYKERDRRLLHALHVYKVAIYPVWSRLFFGGPTKACGHVARRFLDAGFAEIVERGLPGGITYLTLGAEGAKRVGLRDKPKLSGSALCEHLQRYLFCTLSESGIRRYGLFHHELTPVVGDAFPSNVHVLLTEEFGEPVLLRCFHVTGDRPASASQYWPVTKCGL